MDKETAKLILQACRPGGRDRHDPAVQEACQHAENDPQLAAWWSQEQAVDSALGQKFKSIQPPASLLPEILAGYRVSRRRFWFNPTFALAAGILALFTIGFLLLAPSLRQDSFAAFRKDAGKLLAEGLQVDFHHQNPEELRRWLAGKQSVASYNLPAGLSSFPAFGCRTWKWKGRDASILCFRVEGQLVHLFIIPGTELQGAPGSTTPKFGKVGEYASATWTRDGLTYLLTRYGSRSDLEKLL